MVTVTGVFIEGSNTIESIVASDGTIAVESVRSLATVMSSYPAPSNGVLSVSDDEWNTIQVEINNAW
ncbi:hypothetical protein [Hahella ganghwensis]|uniref:hypothetical protein n=1 Tax=Hahella ganghwensis TaxID=286420 RepID=UPI000370CFE4|nr:hypothetical protein [Hahella ganghwensis]